MDVSKFDQLLPAPRVLLNQAELLGDRPRFVLRDGRRVSWRAFAGMMQEAAGFLAAGVLAPGERGAVMSGNRVEWLAAALAIQAAGGVLTPIYPASTAEQTHHVLAHSDARVLFVSAAELPRAREAATPGLCIVCFDDATWPDALAGAAPRALPALDLDAAGLLIYTSGTSGSPKGVPLTHRNVAINGRDWLRCNAPLLEEGAVDLLWLPMSHIFGFGEACLGNTLGFTTHLCEPSEVMAALPEVKPSVFMSVPSVWEKIASAVAAAPEAERARRLAEVTGGRLRFCLSGGAGLPRAVKQTLHEQGVLVIEGYGLTETSPTLTLNRPDAFRFDSVGRPLPSVELRLADDGEILARGPSVFAGYHKDAAATREAFTDDGWFKTGDVGRFTDDGFLQIIDRKKDILVTAGGKNVPPANIELGFRDDAAIAHVVVYGDGKRYLTAGVWLSAQAARLPDDAAHALVEQRVAQVNAGLASYQTIKRWRIMPRPLTVADGLLTATLKVRRKAVYQAFRAEFEGLYE